MGEGISEGIEEEPAQSENPTNNLDKLEDQQVGNDNEEDMEEEHPMEQEHPTSYTTMVSCQVSKPPSCLIEEIGEAVLMAAEQIYYVALSELLEENEFGCIGTGIGSGIENTNGLKVLGFEEAMASADKADWLASVDCEHEQMLKNGVWEVVDHHNIPQGADIIYSMWAMKNKANGVYHA